MGKVLSTEQREQAGSDSYNRFEYQVHTIVYQIINLYESVGKNVIFCEFHDDFSQSDSIDQEIYDFYQVKTRDDGKAWTLESLSKRQKDKKGNYKKSFLGRMFENYLVFGNECRKCYFLSNERYSSEIRTWSACVEDGKSLKKENPELYNKIRGRIYPEFKNELPKNFDDIFDKFIDKSVIVQSDLFLLGYEQNVKMAFLQKFESSNIPISALSVVYDSILNDVRKKSKTKIEMPISKKSLVEKKGINMCQVRDHIKTHLEIRDADRDFLHYLQSLRIENEKCYELVDARRDTSVRLTNSDDYAFIHAMSIVVQQINESIPDKTASIQFGEIVCNCQRALLNNALEYIDISERIIEVKVYERMQRLGVYQI